MVANHASFLDGWFFVHGFPSLSPAHVDQRPLVRRSPIWKWFFKQQATLPVVPNDPVGTILRVVQALENGDMIRAFSRGADFQRWEAFSGGTLGPLGLQPSPVSRWFPAESVVISRPFPEPRESPAATRVENRYGPPRVFPGGKNPEPDPEAVRDFAQLCSSRTSAAWRNSRSGSKRPSPVWPRPQACDSGTNKKASGRTGTSPVIFE